MTTAQGLGDSSQRASGAFISAGAVIQDSFAAFCPLPHAGERKAKLHPFAQFACWHAMFNAQPPSDALSSCLSASELVWLERQCTRNALLGGCVSASFRPIRQWDGTLPLNMQCCSVDILECQGHMHIVVCTL